MIDPKISQLAAELTAAALVALFPKVTLIEARFQRYGFSVDAIVPKGFSIETFPLIEERVFNLPKAKTLEMMGSNAAEYLRASRQVERASQAKTHGKNIITLIQIGDFVNFCPHPVSDAIGGFRLLEHSQNGDHIRIIGAAHATPDETKTYVKNYAKYKKNDHMRCFKVIDGKICFTPEYEAMRFALLCKWREFIHANGGQIYDGPEKPSKHFCGKMITTTSGEGIAGLLDLPSATAFELHNPPVGGVEKFLSSMGLKITKKEKKFYAADAFGTFWCIGTEKMCYASLERILALMIENNCQELLC